MKSLLLSAAIAAMMISSANASSVGLGLPWDVMRCIDNPIPADDCFASDERLNEIIDGILEGTELINRDLPVLDVPVATPASFAGLSISISDGVANGLIGAAGAGMLDSLLNKGRVSKEVGRFLKRLF